MKKMHHIVMNFETGAVTMQPMEATTRAEAEAEMKAIMDDCPDCQAARARGEVPQLVTPPMSVPLSTILKRPRWRDLKRRVRR